MTNPYRAEALLPRPGVVIVKLLNNLPITAKLGILVGVTLLGLSAAGLYSAYMMQQEMFSARVAQTRALVDTARNLAIGLQKQVDAGQMTKEAAIAEFAKRAQTMTYENGTGYMFVYTMGRRDRGDTGCQQDRQQPARCRNQWPKAGARTA